MPNISVEVLLRTLQSVGFPLAWYQGLEDEVRLGWLTSVF